MIQRTRRGSRTILNTSKARSTPIYLGRVLRAFEFLGLSPLLSTNKIGLSTSFSRTAIFAVVALLAPFGVLSSVLLSTPAPAYAAINEELNFQARLLDSTGGLVDDGNYNIQFNIYSGGDGVIGGGDETLEWTGSYLKGNSQGIDVVNGYVNAQLGETASDMPSGDLSTVDWNNSTLWLSINIGDAVATSTTCDTTADFGTNCGGDGEMGPYIRLASTPYAFNAGQLEGRGADQFVQLDPGTQQAVNTGNTLIDVNQTGAGDLINLEVASTQVFGVDNSGNTTVGGALSVAGGTTNGVYYQNASGQLATTTAGATGECFRGITGSAPIWGTCAGTGDIVQGGNSFGLATTIGTNDDFALQFETGGVVNATIADEGAVTFENEVDSALAFSVNNAASAALFVVDTANSQVELNVDTVIAADQSLILVGGTSLPGSPVEGEVFYDSDNGDLYIYDGSEWDILNGVNSLSSTFIVAASDSNRPESADYQGDGVSDDVQINAALDAANTAGGGTVYLMEGTYDIEAAVEIHNNTQLIGAGIGNTRLELDGVLNDALVKKDSSATTGIGLSNLTIDGNDFAGTNAHGIYFSSVGSGEGATAVAGFAIDRVQVTNVDDNGIFAISSSNSTITNSIFEDSNATASSFGINIFSGTNVKVDNNTIEGNAAGGVQISTTSDVSFTNNTIRGTTATSQYALNVNSTTDSTFSNNTITNNTGYGVRVALASYNTFSGNTVKDNRQGFSLSSTATDNLFTGNTVASNDEDGFNLATGSDNNTLTGNNISANSDDGISLAGSDNNVISGNTIADNSLDGIDLTTTANNNNLISGNVIYNNGGTGSSSGINMTSGSGNQIIGNRITDTAGTGNAIDINGGSGTYLADNTYSGTGATDIVDSGTGTIFANQIDDSGNIELQAGSSGAFEVMSNTDITGTLTVSETATFNGNTVIGSDDADTLNVNATSTFGALSTFNNALRVYDGTANYFTLNAEGAIGGNYNISVPTEIAGNDFICLEIAANCAGSGITGTGANGQVAFWDGADSVTGSNDFFWNSGTSRLGLNAGVAPSFDLSFGNGANAVIGVEASGAATPGRNLTLQSGTGGGGGGGVGGNINLNAGTGSAAAGGNINLTGGTGTDGGDVSILGGTANGSATSGGDLTLAGGIGVGTNTNGGNVVISGGNQTGTGTGGRVYVQNASNATDAFQVVNAAGSAVVLNVDTTNNRVDLGSSTTAGALRINDGSNSSVTFVSANQVAATNYDITIPAITADDTVCLFGLNNCAASGGLQQVPDDTATNTVTPTANGVIGLTVNGTSGTAAPALNVAQGGTATAFNIVSSSTGSGASIALTNTSGSQTSGLTIARNGVGGTTETLLNLNNSNGTVTNGISFLGTIGTDITTAGNRALTIDSGGTGAITIGGGTGAKNVNLGTGGTGDKTVSVGSIVGGSTTSILSGTGGVLLAGNTTITGANTFSVGSGAASFNGSVTLGDADADTLTVNANTIQLNGTAFANCTALSTTAGAVGCSSSVFATDLQGSYDGGNTITTTNNRDLNIILDDTATDSDFNIDIADGSTSNFRIRDVANSNLNLFNARANNALVGNTTGSTTVGIFGGSGGINMQVAAGGATIINQSGFDTDLRIEGDTNANLFFVDASTDRIGIGTNTPDSVFQVAGGEVRIGAGGSVDIADGDGDLYVALDAEIDGNVTLGDADADTLTVNANTIQLNGTAFANCTALSTTGGAVGCDSATYITDLQGAYDGGNTLTTTDARDIVIALANTATDSDFLIDIVNGSTSNFRVRDGANSNESLFQADAGAAIVGNTSGATTTSVFGGTGGVNLQAGATGAVVINQSGLDTDFRVEGDTQANLFFVNAGEDAIGIGNDGSSGDFVEITGSPDATVDGSAVLKVEGTLSSTTGDQNGLQVVSVVNTGAASSRRYDGIESTINSFGTADLSTNGVIASFAATGTLQGNVDQYIGFDFTTDSFSGTAGREIGTSYGAVFDNIGLFGSNPLSIGSDIGVSIEDRTGGTDRQVNLLINSDGYNAGLITLGNYSIYNGSTKDNVFAGNLNIGSTDVPTVALDVIGEAEITQDLTLGDGTATGRNIQIADRSVAGVGTALTVSAGSGNGTNGGGELLLQGGDSGASGNVNGGNVAIRGGAGNGTGTQGLVVVENLTFATSSAQVCGSNCTITQGNVDATGAVIVDATAVGLEILLPDPTVTTAGRIIYVTADDGTEDFTLTLNDGTTAEVNISLRENETATIIWNGSDWTAAGASSSNTLQSAYNNTLTSAGGAEIVLNAPGGDADGFTIRNNTTAPIIGGILEVQSAIGTNLFSVNNIATELAANGGAEDGDNFATDWTSVDGAPISRNTNSADLATGIGSVQVDATGAQDGVRNNLATDLATNTNYLVSFSIKADTGDSISAANLDVYYSRNGGPNVAACANASTEDIVDSEFRKFTCTIETNGTAPTNADLIIRQLDAVARTFFIDNLSVTENSASSIPDNVQIGGGQNGGPVTLFTLDRASSPPVANGNQTYLGSMYYDTTSGRIQCYEADGWGACGSAPNNYVNLTPEYPGSVLNGTGVGTMTADFCANQSTILEINTGFCGTGEALNYYNWTSPQATEQEYSIYITYQLPAAFKAFESNDTVTLTARTDSTANGEVSYEMFKREGGVITACGTETTVTTIADTWQTVGINGDEADSCDFTEASADEFVIFKINMKAEQNANVYASTLSFTSIGQ